MEGVLFDWGTAKARTVVVRFAYYLNHYGWYQETREFGSTNHRQLLPETRVCIKLYSASPLQRKYKTPLCFRPSVSYLLQPLACLEVEAVVLRTEKKNLKPSTI